MDIKPSGNQILRMEIIFSDMPSGTTTYFRKRKNCTGKFYDTNC
jgi:hypothetical protein